MFYRRFVTPSPECWDFFSSICQFASPIQRGNMCIYIYISMLYNTIYIYIYIYICTCDWYASVASVLHTLGFFKSSFLQTPSSFFWNPKKTLRHDTRKGPKAVQTRATTFAAPSAVALTGAGKISLSRPKHFESEILADKIYLFSSWNRWVFWVL